MCVQQSHQKPKTKTKTKKITFPHANVSTRSPIIPGATMQISLFFSPPRHESFPAIKKKLLYMCLRMYVEPNRRSGRHCYLISQSPTVKRSCDHRPDSGYIGPRKKKTRPSPRYRVHHKPNSFQIFPNFFFLSRNHLRSCSVSHPSFFTRSQHTHPSMER